MTLEGVHFWPEVLSALSLKLNNPLFRQWTPLTSAQYNGAQNSVIITVPNSFIRDHMMNSLVDIKAIIDDIMFKNTDVKIVVEKNNTEVFEAGASVPSQETSKKTAKKNRSNFIPRFTFENFVVGSNNQFAQAACLSVAARPSKSYNPLFIFGASGLGKTHLLQAIGNYISEYFDNTKVLYITGERFLNEYIKSIRTKTTDAFRKKFREEYDVLLIDDIQFIAGKGQSQEELFHAISSAHENNKQIVIASDKFPDEIEGLDKRLKTRFASGLVCDLKAPELETRLAIVNNKASELNMNISPEAASKIAELFPNSVRELEGAITSIGAYSSFANTKITPDFIEEICHSKQLSFKNNKQIDVSGVIKRVAQHYHVSEGDILGDNRNKDFVLPRHIAVYIAKKLSNRSLSDLARIFKRKNHSTIIHAFLKIEELQKKDINVKSEIDHIINEIKKL
ncbi:MAG: chromosomal replication initiator protein DnaA [Proteobacteria bacterium]|nr:chromosomal replication initiator protein DnaA [Pseudomonadota bacterium]